MLYHASVSETPAQHPSDEALAAAAQRGDMQAFEAIVRRYERELFAFLMHFLGKPDAAEDVFQETCLRLHVVLERFDTSRRFKPWLFTIAANKARDHLRRQKVRRTADLDAPVGHDPDAARFVDLLAGDLPDPNDIAEQSELAEQVRSVIDGLNPNHREALLLAYHHQFTYQEIADMLNVPLSTVKSRLHTAVHTFGHRWKARTAT